MPEATPQLPFLPGARVAQQGVEVRRESGVGGNEEGDGFESKLGEDSRELGGQCNDVNVLCERKKKGTKVSEPKPSTARSAEAPCTT